MSSYPDGFQPEFQFLPGFGAIDDSDVLDDVQGRFPRNTGRATQDRGPAVIFVIRTVMGHNRSTMPIRLLNNWLFQFFWRHHQRPGFSITDAYFVDFQPRQHRQEESLFKNRIGIRATTSETSNHIVSVSILGNRPLHTGFADKMINLFFHDLRKTGNTFAKCS
jgi:hypothetical protein